MAKAWRIYTSAPRHEFGIDYPTLEKAKEVKAEYAKHFPNVVYYIRAVEVKRDA